MPFVLRSFLLLLALTRISICQDAKTHEPPYSKPPKLEHLFTDDFEKDSRGDYQISGKEDAVNWEKGILILGDGAILQRKINAGPWVEMEFNLEFPELDENGQTSSFRVWLDLDSATDSFVWFRQKREGGKTSSAIFIVDTEGEWSQKTALRRVSLHSNTSAPLRSGNWKFSYRNGVWGLSGPERETVLFGYIENGSALVNQIVLTNSARFHDLQTIKVSRARRTKFDPTPHEAEKISEIDSLTQQALGLYQIGDVEQALQILQKARNLHEQVFGRFNLNAPQFLDAMARMQDKKRAYRQAAKSYLEAKTIYEYVLGKNHPVYAESLNQLALIYLDLGSFDEAKRLFLESIAIRKKVLGEQHPEYASSLNNFAGLYNTIGLPKQAEPLYLEAKLIREKTLGKEHADYANSLNNLGMLYLDLGSYEQAEPYLLEARDVNKKVQGLRNADYARSLNNLGLLYKEMGSYSLAEPLYQEAKAIWESVVGKQHPYYAVTLNGLGLLFVELGEYEKAEQHLLEAKTIREKVFGNAHPEYAGSLNNLAHLYCKMKAFEKAEELFLESKRIRETSLGKESLPYATSLNNLASLYESMGSFDRAESLYIAANKILEKVLTPEHPDYASNFYNLAILYFRQGKNKQAEEHLSAAIQITRRNFDRYSVFQSRKEQQRFVEDFDVGFSLFVSNELQLANRGAKLWNQAIQWKGISLLRQRENQTLAKKPETMELYQELQKSAHSSPDMFRETHLRRHGNSVETNSYPKGKNWKKSYRG